MIKLIGVFKIYHIHLGRALKAVLCRVGFRVISDGKWRIHGRNKVGKSSLIYIINDSAKRHSEKILKMMTVSWPLVFVDAFQSGLPGRNITRLIARVYGVDFQQTLEIAEDFAELGPYPGKPV